jgi:hypothetical protein
MWKEQRRGAEVELKCQYEFEKWSEMARLALMPDNRVSGLSLHQNSEKASVELMVHPF